MISPEIMQTFCLETKVLVRQEGNHLIYMSRDVLCSALPKRHDYVFHRGSSFINVFKLKLHLVL